MVGGREKSAATLSAALGGMCLRHSGMLLLLSWSPTATAVGLQHGRGPRIWGVERGKQQKPVKMRGLEWQQQTRGTPLGLCSRKGQKEHFPLFTTAKPLTFRGTHITSVSKIKGTLAVAAGRRCSLRSLKKYFPMPTTAKPPHFWRNSQCECFQIEGDLMAMASRRFYLNTFPCPEVHPKVTGRGGRQAVAQETVNCQLWSFCSPIRPCGRAEQVG